MVASSCAVRGGWRREANMARLIRVTIDVYPPSEQRPDYCVESWEQVRSSKPNRVLHFSLKNHPAQSDVDWVVEVLGTQFQNVVSRTIGLQEELAF
jgi:hypothetical protein